MAVMPVFTEQQAERLTGLSRQTLSRWRREGVFRPTYEVETVPGPYRRLYGFADVVRVRLLATLRREHQVPLDELRRTAELLAELGGDLRQARMWVSGRRVSLADPGAVGERGHEVVEIDVAEVWAAVDAEAATLRRRDPAMHGHITRSRFVMHNAWVIAGTRIPTSAIQHFHEDGYGEADILEAYPGLVADDIRAALEHERSRATAA